MICTRDRADQLGRTLRRVAAIRSELKWELVIVDNGSRDETKAVVAEYARACDHPLQTIIEGRRGVSRAKNAGWRAARSDLIVSIDDDCYPEEDYLDAIFECFTRDKKVGFAGGRILLHDPRDRRITIQESLEPVTLSPGSFIGPGVIQGANIAYRRAALSEIGGFDPWFGGGALYSGEEVELMARMSAAGWSGVYDPKPVVYHHHGRQTRMDEWRLRRWYDRGRGAYFGKCILNKQMRNVYIKKWLLARQYQSWGSTAVEIAAGLDYVARACLAGRSLNGNG